MYLDFISHPGVCLIEQESGGDTRKITYHGKFAQYYGVFQIPSTDGCGKGFKHGICNINCEGICFYT